MGWNDGGWNAIGMWDVGCGMRERRSLAGNLMFPAWSFDVGAGSFKFVGGVDALPASIQPSKPSSACWVLGSRFPQQPQRRPAPRRPTCSDVPMYHVRVLREVRTEIFDIGAPAQDPGFQGRYKVPTPSKPSSMMIAIDSLHPQCCRGQSIGPVGAGV